MRKVDRSDAISEFGVRFVPSLEGLELRLGHDGLLSASEALAKKLEDLSRGRFDGVINMKEELGPVFESFHFRDLQDVRDRYETEQRAHYKKAYESLAELMTAPQNAALLEQAAESRQLGQQRLKAAFEKAYEKLVVVEEFLSSRRPFKVEVEPMKSVLTLPDTILNKGDTVFVVSDNGKDVPVLETGKVAARNFHGAFFSKADFSVGYVIDTGAAVKGDENIFYSADASEQKSPAGAVAKGHGRLAFNTKAAAAVHIGTTLDAKEVELKAQLKQLRAQRRQLGKPSA